MHDVVKCITNDREATGVVFGIFTPAPWEHMDDRPYDDVIGILAGELSQHSIKVRDGWIISETSFTNYFQIVPDPLVRSPLETIKTSELNAELMFRGSSIEPGPGFRIPILARRDLSEEVFKNCLRIEAMTPTVATAKARTLWGNLLDGADLPTDAQSAELLADFKFISVRDRLLADIPGLEDSLGDLLLGQTKRPPHWQRVDRAQELLLHLYTRADGPDAAPHTDKPWRNPMVGRQRISRAPMLPTRASDGSQLSACPTQRPNGRRWHHRTLGHGQAHRISATNE